MDIQQIKQQLSILKVLAHYNLTPDRNNRLKCPFHEDKTPSFHVYPKTGTWNCFSSNCSAGSGDQVDFIMKLEGISKHEAIMKAKEMLGYIAPEAKPTDYVKLFEDFKYTLLRSSKAKEYLKSRNLTLPYVGYNSGSKYDKLKYCIIFPLRDSQNQISSLYGRSIFENENAKHFYTGNRKGLYPSYPKADTSKLILTEAIIDAATLLQIPEITREYAVLALYGTNGLTEEHKQAIKELNQLKEIVLFFDGDEAGREAITKQAETLQQLCPKVKITYAETPQDEDINSLSLSHEPEIFTHLLQTRKTFHPLTDKFSLSIENKKPGTGELTGSVPASSSGALAKEGRLNTKNPEFITYTADNLQVVLLGGISLHQLDRLRVTLKISRTDTSDPLHSIRHTLDLYNSDYLEKFIIKTSERLETGTTQLNRTFAQLIDEIERYRLSRIESQKEQKPRRKELTEQQRQKAISYLKSPKLMERTGEDIGRTGVIGEENNRLLMYLVFTSRLREQPLHIISLGASGTGKTYLQEKIAELVPEHDKLEITILSENAFYYFEETELRHKLVLIEDMDGAEQVLYPLRELQSKKKISKTIPIKDSKGNLKTITLKVEGPICLAGTTTRERLYEDNANRSLLIYLDNTREHKEQIMNYQRKLSAGKIAAKEEKQLIEFFKDMQTVLKPVKVRNPFAEYLVIPQHVFKPLRTNSHYLAFIETITFYHQYQRETKTDPDTNERYIETTLEDIEWANKLLKDVLLAKADELPNAVRTFFESLKSWLSTANKNSFYAKEVRDVFRMHPSKVKRYLNDLLRYNFIKVVGGNRYKSGLEYEIINTDEYKKLESGITTALDDVLSNLKNKISGSVAQQWSKAENRPLNGKEVSNLNPVVQ